MVTIAVTSDISLEFTSSIKELFRVWSEIIDIGKTREIIVDLSNCRFCSCIFLLGLHILHRQFLTQGYQISLNTSCTNVAFASYLSFTSFGESMSTTGLTREEINNLFLKYAGKTYLPLINFPAKELAVDVEVRERLLESLSQSIRNKLQLDSGIFAAVTYLIDEAVNNISDHARTQRGYIFAQFYPKKQFMDICIADMGISLLGSYKAVGRVDVLTFEQAMQSALNGDSTKDDPNRGFGIRTSRKMLVHGLGGRYFMMSGNAFLYSRPGRGEKIAVIDQNLGIQWNGTYLALRIPVQKNPDFNIYDYTE